MGTVSNKRAGDLHGPDQTYSSLSVLRIRRARPVKRLIRIASLKLVHLGKLF